MKPLSENEMNDHLEIIKSSKLFEGVDPKVYKNELEDCKFVFVEVSDILIDCGSENSNTYMVLSGALSIHLEKIDNASIRDVNRGETVGELSLLGETKATAFVVVSKPSQLLVIPRQLMWGLIRKSAGISQNLLFILTDWIITDNKRFLDRSREMESLRGLSQLDGLTGLLNRRELDKCFNRIYTRSQMSGHTFAIIMLDVDHFKKYNDVNGHQGGDQALIALAHVLTEAIRPVDIVGRYGGEEFTVILPDSTAKDAIHVAERLRVSVEKRIILSKNGSKLPGITVSLGVGESSEGCTINGIIELADANLYKAKKRGRNQTCF